MLVSSNLPDETSITLVARIPERFTALTATSTARGCLPMQSPRNESLHDIHQVTNRDQAAFFSGRESEDTYVHIANGNTTHIGD
jgi:hypothetical protein